MPATITIDQNARTGEEQGAIAIGRIEIGMTGKAARSQVER